MEPFVTTDIAAQLVGLSKWYLYRNANKIPAAHRAGRALRWDTTQLKEWMRAQAMAQANGHGE